MEFRVERFRVSNNLKKQWDKLPIKHRNRWKENWEKYNTNIITKKLGRWDEKVFGRPDQQSDICWGLNHRAPSWSAESLQTTIKGEKNCLKINQHMTRELWDQLKRHNIRIIEVPETKEENLYVKGIFKDIVEKFPNLKSAYTHSLDARRISAKWGLNKNAPSHSLIINYS